MRVCFLCTIFSRLLCGNFLFDSAALQSSLCSVVQIQYLTSLIAAEHFPGKSRRVTRKTLPQFHHQTSVRHTRCRCSGVHAQVCTFHSFHKKQSIFSPLCTDYTVFAANLALTYTEQLQLFHLLFP